MLVSAIGPRPLSIVDVGCGTGSLSILLAEMGHDVHGLDYSAGMLAAGKKKARGLHRVTFSLGDASVPDPGLGPFDAAVGRHILWALPDPATALTNWRKLLEPSGRLVLIEGFWETGAGLTSQGCLGALAGAFENPVLTQLGHDADLWGRQVLDERYMIVARAAR